MKQKLLSMRDGTLFQRMFRAHVKQTSFEQRDSGWDYAGYVVILMVLGFLLSRLEDLS